MNLTILKSRTCAAVIAGAMLFANAPVPGRALPIQPQDQSGAEVSLRDLHSANGLLQRGMFDLAAAEYQKFLKAHPDHAQAAEANYGLGVCYVRLNKPADALGPLRKAIEQNGFEFAVEASFLLGQCHLNAGSFNDSAKAFARIVENHREHELADDAAALLVESHSRAGNHEQAVKSCDALLQSWPDSPQRERAEFIAAQSALAMGDSAVAAQRLTAMLQKSPKGEFADRAQIMQAQCLQRAGKIEESVAAYRQIVSAASHPYRADALYGVAVGLHGLGQFDQATNAIERLLKEFPTYAHAASAQLLACRMTFDQQQYEKALAMFRAAGETSKDRQDQAQYWQAKCELRLGRPEQAAKRLDQAIEKHPASALRPEMMFDRAVARVRAKNANAAASLQSFLAEFPEHALAAEAMHLTALWHHQHAEYQQSTGVCRQFAVKFPDHRLAAAMAFLNGENQYLAGRFADAAESFESFVATYPRDAQLTFAKFRLGAALYRLNQFDQAAEILAPLADVAADDDTFRPALLILGEIHYQQRRWPDAEKHLKDYAERIDDKDHDTLANALLKLAIAQARQEQYEEALNTLDQVNANEAETSLRVHIESEKAECLVALQRPDEAAVCYERVLKMAESESPMATHALNQLAAGAMQRKDFRAAAHLYGRIIAAAGDDEALAGEARYQRGQALLAGGDVKAAEREFAQVVSKTPSHPRAASASARQALALAKLGQHVQALELMQSTLKSHGGQLDPALAMSLRYEQAWCHRAVKDDEKARASYQEILSNKGDFDPSLQHQVTLELAELEQKRGEVEAAAELLKPLIDEENVAAEVRESARYRLAVCEYQAERHKQAAALFESFIQRNPESPQINAARLYCGESMFKSGQFKPAAAHLSQALEQMTDDSSASTALLRLAECQAQMQQWESSEQTFATHRKRFPDSDVWHQAQFGIGWARENQQQYESAIEAYQPVADKHQGVTAARAQFQIGECHFAMKNHDEALRELLKVEILYAYPEWSSAALYEAGRCMEAMQRSGEARVQFEQVKTKYPQTRWASMAQQRLAALGASASPSVAEAAPGGQ